MHTTHSYYPSNALSNVIEITDAYSSHPNSSTSPMLTIHQSHPCTTDALYKKRKIERACDACRRRKTKCDGPRMPDNVCSNCIQNRKTCSYIEASKPRGPPKAYITGLEDRLEKMEVLLKRLRPESDFSEELGSPVIRDSWKNDTEPARRPPSHEKSSSPSASSSRPKSSPSGSLRCSGLPPVGISNTVNSSSASQRGRRSAGTPRTDTDLSSEGYTSSESEEVGELSLSRGMKRLTIRGLEPAQENSSLTDSQVRFHGKSSCFKLIEPTRKLRDEHMHRVSGAGERSRLERDSASPVNAAATRRPEFWTTPPQWELAFEGFQNRLGRLCPFLIQEFPPPDLADNLIELYFDHVNPQFPLFHQPTFERQWREGLHKKDPWFGCLCLSLFAVASRWSDDPRVLDDGEYDVPEAERPTDEYKWQRAGWKYFNTAVDVHRDSRSLFHPPGLFEVQTMSLLGMFLRGTAFHPVAWLFISIGLRKAQDVAAHRKKVYGDKPSVEEELWKRAFWMLVLYDRIGSAALGRPCCSGEEDFDVDLPLEVDDEYWESEDPKKEFQQPPGKPSRIAAFNSYLKLTKIAAYALRTIYALDRSKLLLSAARPRWQEVLTQLNNAMIEWVDSVPPHLQWAPHIEDQLFANQSATLYITYYLIQIIIYRPFLPPSLRSPANMYPHSSMPVPCIAICVNAAKCCSRILKSQVQRGLSNIPSLICSAHMCAAVLLMNFWDLKWQERNHIQSSPLEDVKSPLALAMAEVLEDVAVFFEALELVKPRWRNAEMYLKELSTSLPHSLGGFEPDSRKDDAVPQYGTLPEYRNPPPEYRAVPPPMGGFSYYCNDPSTQNPHFFEFPHITRFPVPGTLPLPSQLPLSASELAWGPQMPMPSQVFPSTTNAAEPAAFQARASRPYGDLPMNTGAIVRKPSASSLQSRPMRPHNVQVNGTATQPHDTPRGHFTAGRMAYDVVTPLTAHEGVHAESPAVVREAHTGHQARYEWTSDWTHSANSYTYGGNGSIPSRPAHRATQPGFTSGRPETNYQHGDILSYSGHY
ncbi:fungal-specific transcription factor domain-containing protein [Phlebopus sp. FC_14]|nr:fungal-specific transcription factor domain-containing protein [Phlebopus sp. FC_14]